MSFPGGRFPHAVTHASCGGEWGLPRAPPGQGTPGAGAWLPLGVTVDSGGGIVTSQATRHRRRAARVTEASTRRRRLSARPALRPCVRGDRARARGPRHPRPPVCSC